ncbi:DAK2 domain-containing protein, partial [Kocuria oceani]
MPEVTAEGLERWLRRFADVVHDHAAELTELDSAIGDADHGSNMDRGMRAVVGALDGGAAGAPDALLKKTGMTLVSTVGGASGPL